MADIYFGDTWEATDGNWNNVNNWYSSPGAYSSKGPNIPGILAGRLPTASADLVYVTSVINIGSTYTPIWTGNIAFFYSHTALARINGGTYSCSFLNTTTAPGQIGGGTFNNCNMSGSLHAIYGGTFNSCSLYYYTVFGGNFNGGNFATPPNHTANFPFYFSGSNITASNLTMNIAEDKFFISLASASINNLMITMSNGTIASGDFRTSAVLYTTSSGIIRGGIFSNLKISGGLPRINGGTYAPSGSLILTLQPTKSVSGIINDLGFSVNGTFTPYYTYVGLPDILGNGLL